MTMNISELLEHLIENVPNFENPEIISEGECFHYTSHWEKIKELGKFKGAKIDADLDQTQTAVFSSEATESEGVVFAYSEINEAREEGNGLDIVKIRYKTAIKALHKGENALDCLFTDLANKSGIEMSKINTPYTLLILTSDISSFELIPQEK